MEHEGIYKCLPPLPVLGYMHLKGKYLEHNGPIQEKWYWQTTHMNEIKKFMAFILLRSNEMQQYAGVYLLQNYSTCFGCLSHPSSGAHQTVTAASGTV